MRLLPFPLYSPDRTEEKRKNVDKIRPPPSSLLSILERVRCVRHTLRYRKAGINRVSPVVARRNFSVLPKYARSRRIPGEQHLLRSW